MARHLSADTLSVVISLLRGGRSLRDIQALTGVAGGTCRTIIRTHGVERPACGCGRPGGHKGMCSMRLQPPTHARPSSPNWNVAGARTELGALMDRHAAAQGLTMAAVARGTHLTSTRINHLRHGHRLRGQLASRAVVSAETVDCLVAFFELGSDERTEMHCAAATDWGYDVPSPAALRAVAAEIALLRREVAELRRAALPPTRAPSAPTRGFSLMEGRTALVPRVPVRGTPVRLPESAASGSSLVD